MILSPIVLFIYNRPLHTQRVLDGLANNPESKQSILYIFSDGLKENAPLNDLDLINQTRAVVENESRFKEVIIIKNDKNKGLANSIIDGVNLVLSSFEKIIVIEDDILPQKGFLKYMNEALNLYEATDEIGCIHAWNYTFNKNSIKQSTFLLKGADCWGWGTWKRAWDLFESNGSLLLNEIQSNNLEFEFDRKNTHAFTNMLKDQIVGKNNSWAIRWHASLFLANKFCVHPRIPIVKNIGFDGSGTHCDNSDILQITTNKINLNMIYRFKESEEFYQSYSLGVKKKTNIMGKIKSVLSLILPPVFIIFCRKVFVKKNQKDIILNYQATNKYWNGNYESWEIAETNCKGYDSDIIVNKCFTAIQKVALGQVVYERDSVVFDHKEYSTGLLASLFLAGFTNSSTLSVLDFGGSLGTTYFQNSQFFHHFNNCKWGIIEQEKFYQLGKKHFANNELIFFETIDSCISEINPNLFLVSSSLQYIPNPGDLLMQINTSKIRFIVFDRIPFSDGENILTIQTVMPEIYEASYPCWIFNYQWLIDNLSNYKVLFDFSSFCDNNQIINDNLLVKWKGLTLELK